MKPTSELSRRMSAGLAIVAALGWGAFACNADPQPLPGVPIRSGETVSSAGGKGGASGGGASGSRRAGRDAGSRDTSRSFDAGRSEAGSAAQGPVVDVQSTGPGCDIEACQSPGAAIYACCLPDGSCGAGVNSECRPVRQPGVLDATCPSHRAWDDTLEFAGCCRPNDRCGVDVSLGLGCVERTDLPSYLNGPLTAFRCSFDDPGDAGVDDAGTEDAGAVDADAGKD